MQRIVFNSRDDLKNAIEQINEEETNYSRASELDLQFSNNEELFVSLVEANRRKVFESLTPEQLDSILNDEDELEFNPSDSIIRKLSLPII